MTHSGCKTGDWRAVAGRTSRALLAAFMVLALDAKASADEARPLTTAQASRCGLALVFAIDVSSSVDARDYRLQMEGLANALRNPVVQQAVVDTGGVLATAFEWSGRNQQVEIEPWRFLVAPSDIEDFAAGLETHQRRHTEFPTALGYAMGHAATIMRGAPLDCARRVIDVSGDGVNNEGFEPPLAYANFPFAGVQVNALVIAGANPDPVDYFTRNVLHGPGAFLEIAEGFDDYEEAMIRKLLREIRGAALSSVNPVQDRARQ